MCLAKELDWIKHTMQDILHVVEQAVESILCPVRKRIMDCVFLGRYSGCCYTSSLERVCRQHCFPLSIWEFCRELGNNLYLAKEETLKFARDSAIKHWFCVGGEKNKKECIVLFTSNNHHYVIQPSDPCYFYPNVIFVIPVIDCFSVLKSNSSCQIFQQPDNPLFSLFLVPIFIKITKQVSYLWDRGQLPFPSGHCSQNQHTEQLSSLENLQDTRCHN